MSRAPTPTTSTSQWPEREALPLLFKHEAVGTRREAGGVGVRRDEPACVLLYGPYWQLPAGSHRLRFDCRVDEARGESEAFLGVEVIAQNRLLRARRDFSVEDLAQGAGWVDFSVPFELSEATGETKTFEFRFLHFGVATFDIASVRLTPGSGAVPQEERWRLLPRMHAGPAVVRNAAGHLVLEERRRRGCLTVGPTPLLYLPAGPYVVAFECAAKDAGAALAPILRVTVKTRSAVLARHRFGADALRGVTMFQIEVSPDEALESGRDEPISLLFEKAAAGRLTLSSLEIRPLCARGDPARQDWGIGAALRGGPVTVVLPAGRHRLSADAAKPIASQETPLEVDLPQRGFPFGRGFATGVTRAWRRLTARLGGGYARIFRRMTDEGLDFDAPQQGNGETAATLALRRRRCDARFENLSLVALGAPRLAQRPAPAAASLRGGAARTRRSIVIVGNCQAEVLCRGLDLALDADKYRTVYHFAKMEPNLLDYARRDLDACDILLAQDIRDFELYPLRAEIPAKLRIVQFPCLWLASPWPFDGYNGPTDSLALEREGVNLAFPYLDGLLAKLRREIPDPNERFDAYLNLAVDGLIDFARLHRFEERRLLAMDRQYETDIGAFVLDRFRKARIWHTTNHPGGELLAMLLAFLGERAELGELQAPLDALDKLGNLQVPVHPKVARALDIAWAGEETRYSVRGSSLTFEQYARRYIAHYG